MKTDFDCMTQETMDLIKRGIFFRERFIERSDWKQDDFLIVLSGDKPLDDIVLKIASLCFDYYQTKRVLVLSDYIPDSKKDNIEFYQCAADENDAFAALFRLYRFSTRIAFADISKVSQYPFDALVGVCGITYEDLIERAVLGIMLPGNPIAFDEKIDLFSDHRLNEQLELFERGRLVYRDIRSRYNNEEILYNNRATGNTYILCGLLPEYVKQKKMSYIVMNSRHECQKICGLYDINSECIPSEDGDALKLYCDTVGAYDLGFRTMDPYNIHNKLIRMRGFKGLDFLTIYGRVLYETDTPEAFISPIAGKDAQKYLDELKLAPGKTVIVSPVSNTLGILDDEEWERLINILKENGYDVVLNLPEDHEGFPGVKKFLCPYDSITDFASKCGYFIGVRSGLCDILTGSDCMMYVIYPETGRKIRDNAIFDYFSLENMKLRNKDLLELRIGKSDKFATDLNEMITGDKSNEK